MYHIKEKDPDEVYFERSEPDLETTTVLDQTLYFTDTRRLQQLSQTSNLYNWHTPDPHTRCCGSGSVLDPYSGALWIRIWITHISKT